LGDDGGGGEVGDVEWEIVVDDGEGEGEGENKETETEKTTLSEAGDKTIRFRSFRRSLQLDMPPFDDSSSSGDYFSRSMGIGPGVGTVNRAALNRVVSNHKMRKSVVGLFDTSVSASTSAFKSKPRVPFPIDTDSSVRISTNALPSPASTLSIAMPSPSPTESDTGEKRRTLRSELGSEFGDDDGVGGWGENGGNHHLRNTNLYQLNGPSESMPPSPISGLLSFKPLESHGFQPQPTVVADDHHPRQRGDRANRYHRLSQTIRSRTNQWLDGRFKETLPSSNNGESSPRNNQVDSSSGFQSSLAPVPQKLALATMFDSVVDTFTRPRSIDGEWEQEPAAADDGDNSRKPVNLKVQQARERVESQSGASVGRVILELWLWLQFVIIVLVFLWAMAKRGPKSVLGEANKRRVISAKQS
jgi:hypothetical protein